MPHFADRAVLAIACVLPTAVTWLYFIALDAAPPRFQQGVYALGKAIQFALPVVWVILIRREWPVFRRPSVWSLAAGAVFGVVVAAAMAVLFFAVLEPAGHFDAPALAIQAKVKSFGVSSLPAYFALALFYSTIHSLLEEYYWRWFVFGQLARQTAWPTAAVISGIAFAAHHVLVLAKYFGYDSPWTWLFALSIAIGGALWAWLYRASDSLAVAWLSHAVVDVAIFAIGYLIVFG